MHTQRLQQLQLCFVAVALLATMQTGRQGVFRREQLHALARNYLLR